MARLIIEQVRGGFFLVDGNDRSVASIDTLAVEVRCWADSLPVIQPRVLPPVAPDAAPAPFRVGDRVVRRDASQMVHYDNKPLVVVKLRNAGVVAVTHDGKVRLAFDNDELRHAPEEV